MKSATIFGIALVLSLSLILGACAPAAAPAETVDVPAEAAVEGAEQAETTSEPVTLKIAVLPITDTLPLFVARDEGIFAEMGLDVEFIPVSSAPERDQIITAGHADGMVTDAMSVLFFNKEETQLQIVRYAQKPSDEAGHFFVLAAKDSGIVSVEDLKGVEVGISEGTVIEYMLDRLLEREGFAADEIASIAVPKIPDRMALLGSGELKAAVLPDPLASLAVSQGATIILDDKATPEYGASVYVFTKSMIDENPEAMQAFVDAIDQAIALLSENPEAYLSVLADNKLVPPPLMESYAVPPFPSGNFSEAEWADTLDWAKGKGLIDVDVPYENVVFLE